MEEIDVFKINDDELIGLMFYSQLRKIGRKYRMQAEEVQKELDELKAKGNQADLVAEIQEKLTKSEAEIKQQQEKVKKMEKEVEEVTGKLVASEFEKNEAWKNVKELEMKEKLLLEQIVKLKDVSILFIVLCGDNSIRWSGAVGKQPRKWKLKLWWWWQRWYLNSIQCGMICFCECICLYNYF